MPGHVDRRQSSRDGFRQARCASYFVKVPNFFEWLALLFIGLRLAGITTMPWVWVLVPLWLPVCLVILIACVVVLCGK